ncbi:EAL domain-containing protein [Methylomicrobium sp. Wu6]|uniref:EAL domain-containing protein n=1 Tax=Methylomicrobium sp. Wu6 TaxID=3107928 RepID=UPI002DD66C17|nr:EAL domain-containing protein [Methylomicrobium sp. Wu6]MEC4749987.1 EAL domain-containing protein [Methylomicrobium sp. Wu6]
MKRRTFRSYRLKIWLPLSSFLLFFCLLSGVVWGDYRNTLELAQQRTESTLQGILKRLKMRLEDAIAKDEREEIDQDFNLIDLQSGTEAIALIDDRDAVVASNNPIWRHRPASETLPGFDRGRLARARLTLHIDMRYDPQSQRYTVYVPVRFQSGKHALRSPNIGAVYYVYDNSYVESAMWRQLINNYALVWPAILVVFVLSWLIWNFLLFRPLQHLLPFIKQIAANDPAARNPLTGDGELAQLGRMLEQNHQTQQQTLRTLKQGEHVLAVTLQSVGNGLITTDTQGVIATMNPIAEQLTGWPAAEGIGQPVEKVLCVINVNTSEVISLPIRHVLKTRQLIRQTHQVLLHSRTGNTFHIEISSSPILDDEGDLYGVILTFNDVSDKYRLREQLHNEKRYLQHLIDYSATAIYSLLPKTKPEEGFRFNYGSIRLEQLSGFSIHEWETVEDLWRSRVHPNDLERVKDAVQQAVKKGRIVECYRFLHGDGRYRWIEDHLTSLTNAAGETYELLGDWLDITEIREAELKSQMLGVMLDQSINEIMVIDSKTLYFLHVNEGGLNNLGYSLAEFVKMTLLDVYPQYDMETLARLIAPLLLGKQSRLHFESVHRRKDGSRYPVEVWLQFHHNASDMLIVTALDITQRKQQEEKIKRLNNFYAVLTKINQAIVQIRNEAELFADVCEIVLEMDVVRMVWIGKLDAATATILPVAATGDRLHYLDELMISINPDLPEGQGPAGTAFRENRIVVVNDFQHDPMTALWHDNGSRLFGWKASCGVPIMLNHQPYALLNVYADQVHFFDAEVLDLLTELSLDLSFALGLYAREAVRRSAEQKMELWAKVFSQNREAVIIADHDNRIVSVNQAFTRITGYEEHDVLGKNSRLLSSGLHGKDFHRLLWKSLIENDFWQGELVERKKDGSLYTEWLSISVVRDEAGGIVNYIAIFTDITQLKAAKQQIEYMAHYDALTGLPNRLLLKARVDHEISIADRNKQTFALLFIDLDHFKNINDALGHSVGDQVLIEVGKRLLAAVRDEDTVARVGGDEFNIQLANTDWHGAAAVAKKIISALDEAIHYQHYQLHIQPSIGIGLYPENGDNFETLSRNADTALYKAKEHGRNQYQFFTPAMQQQTQRRMELERHLRNALENKELTVFYQPLFNTKTQRINGAEALLRWRHPELGWVSPSEFIPIAEECGLILSIGDWVLEQAIVQARRWHEASYLVSVAVNLSLAQFRANTLYETVRYFLEKYQLPPRFLELELTESIAMHNVEAAIEITRQLSELGVEISIDDFGTGYSSLSYLQRFSLNKLKIDQSFTRSMADNKESENIVDAIISLAKSLKMKTIAEGVETEQQWASYLQKDCDEIQGFYFSKPVPADEFGELLKRYC